MEWIFISILSVLCCVYDSQSYQFSNSLKDGKTGIRIVSLHIRSEVQYRFATTHVTSSLLNEDLKDKEAVFDVTLPEAAFISNFSLEIMGKRYIGEITDKDTAKKQYEHARRRGQTAGHLVMKPRDTNKFKVVINVAPLSEVTFYLTYNEILQRRRGYYDHTIYINPRQIVDDFRIEVYIQESREITLLRVPPLRNDILSTYNTAVRNRYAEVQRTSLTSAFVRYNPSREDQLRASMHGLSGLFIVEYDVDRSMDAGDVLIVDGFFVHFFAPAGLHRMSRRIMFILDTSGSMIGTKIQQLKDAMMEILDDLQENDMFNIIEFNDKINRWSKDAPVKYATPEAISSSKEFINNLTADGWTNIHDAVLEGLGAIQSDYTSDAMPVIIFLTDGEPTAGETDLVKILNAIQGKNTKGAPIFSLAFGENADYNFLRKMSAQNNAFSRKIYEASDATLQLTGFYDEVSSVLISNLTFHFLGKETIKSTITNALIPNYFEGSEIVITGKLASKDVQELRLAVTGSGINGTMEFRSTSSIYIHGAISGTKNKFEGFSYSHVAEKMWAYLTIKQLLNDRLREWNTTKRHDMKYRALQLALKYNFVTPLTSMVVTTPSNKGKNNVIDPNEDEFGASDDPYSYGSNNIPQRKALAGAAPSFVDNDPHFIVHMKGVDTSICFDIMGIPGDIINLVRDEVSGIVVNGIIVSNKRIFTRKKRKGDMNENQELKTYLGSIIISGKGTHISITPERWILNGEVHKWVSSELMTSYKTKIVTDGTGEMIVVMFPNRITLLVMRHMRTKSQKRVGKVDFLGFYIVEDKGFSSKSTHGLLGQFLYRKVTLEKKKTLKNGRTRGKLKVYGNTRKPRRVVASLGRRLNLATNSKVECWMVSNNGKRLLDGNYMDYINRRNITDYIKRLGGG